MIKLRETPQQPSCEPHPDGVRKGSTHPTGTAVLTLLDLSELELDRRGSAEDRNGDLEARASVVHLFHGAVEGRERTVGHADLFADFEGHRRLWPLDTLLDLMQDAGRFHLRDRHRLIVGAKEARYLRGILDEM